MYKQINKITQKGKIKYIFDFVNEISVYKIRLHSAKPQSIRHIECKIFSLNCLIFSFEINIFFFYFVKEIPLVSKSGYILPNHKVQGI
jgi:hypothetical protein